MNYTHIALNVRGGLCNRLDALSCAVALINSDPSIDRMRINAYWEVHEECGAEFDQLFQALPTKDLRVKRVCRPWLKHARKRNLYYPKLLRLFAFDASFISSKIRNRDIYEVIKGKRRIYIEGNNEFCTYSMKHSLATLFRPVPTISRRIEDITKLYTERTVGVHIRRTDHRDAILNSPLEAFTSKMDEELRLRPSTTFYVATDDPDTKQQLLARYPNRVISPPWELRRDTLRGMRDAVADLYCLGKTCEIWGSHRFTFSIDAAALYDIPLIMVRGKEPISFGGEARPIPLMPPRP